jgi:hypothetical protein
MLLDVPVTVTAPDSTVEGGVPPPPLLLPPPQLRLAIKSPARIRPPAAYRKSNAGLL